MIDTLIFDVSEVLIMGLGDLEPVIADDLGICAPEAVWPSFGGDVFYDYLVGDISENIYLETVIRQAGWQVHAGVLKKAIRDNFHRVVDGSASLVERLHGRYQLVLLSDHGREWVSYIRSIHPFLDLFDYRFFSYELRSTKSSPDTFAKVLRAIRRSPKACLFIDDSPGNVASAEQVGIAGILFEDMAQLIKELRQRQISF